MQSPEMAAVFTEMKILQDVYLLQDRKLKKFNKSGCIFLVIKL